MTVSQATKHNKPPNGDAAEIKTVFRLHFGNIFKKIQGVALSPEV